MESPYYFTVRHDLINLIPLGTRKVLEVGCAGGMTGKELKEKGIEEIVGIERIEEIARQGKEYYNRLFIGDVERMELPYEKGYFDCILYPDVLEHLQDPWNIVRKQSSLVKMNGVILCSIPNIRHYRVIKKLALKGEWEYQDDGIMDRTHLRFFTLRSVTRLFTDAGFELVHIVKKPSGAKWLKMLNSLTGGSIIDYLVRQYIIVAVKKSEVAE